MLNVVEGRLQSDSDDAGDDERGELHLGIDRIRADPLRKRKGYPFYEMW